MRNITITILLILSFVFTNNLKATSYMGGEIYWECISAGNPDAGKFVFYLRLYKSCDSTVFGNNQILNSNSPAGDIGLTLESGYPKTITKVCKESAFTGVGFINCNDTVNTNGAVTEYLYKSSGIILNAVPPALGWTFSFSSSGRSIADNMSASSSGFYLKGKMYPYNSSNVYPCFDNSPQFVESAQPIINGGFPSVINAMAYDMELDSLGFEWGMPLQNDSTAVAYTTAYSYGSHLPGVLQNSNNSNATFHPRYGLIEYESYTEGLFLMSCKVKAYKCGTLVSENWREVTVNIINQVNNLPPTIDIGFNSNNNLIDTVYPGDVVSFPINISDLQYLPDGSAQQVEFNAYSRMFGDYVPATSTTPATYSSVMGCLGAPCATLTPAPSPILGITGDLNAQVQFNWTVTCDHLAVITGCGVTDNRHDFYYKASDNYCPLPAEGFIKHSFIVLPRPFNYSAKIECINRLQNGDVELKWNPINDTTGRFLYYEISSVDLNNNYTLLDTIYNMGENSYMYNQGSLVDTSTAYVIRIHTNCFPNYLESNRVKPITLSTIDNDPCKVNLSWNAISNSQDSVYYKVYKRNNNAPWLFLDSTQSTSYYDESSVGLDYFYKIVSEDVSIIDSNGNYYIENSVSNILELNQLQSVAADTTICINHSISLLSANQSAVSFLWSDGTTGSSLYLLGSDLGIGIHQIWIESINSDGCISYDTVNVTVDACASIDELKNSLNFNIFPNPSDGKFSVMINAENNNIYSYEIIDMKGVVILQDINLGSEFNIDLTLYPASKYLLRIKSDNKFGQRILILR